MKGWWSRRGKGGEYYPRIGKRDRRIAAVGEGGAGETHKRCQSRGKEAIEPSENRALTHPSTISIYPASFLLHPILKPPIRLKD